MTFGVALAGKMEWVKAIWYWVAQIVGAVLAAFVLHFVLPVPGSLGATTLASGVSPIQGVVIEVILTVFLVLSVMESGVLGKNGNGLGVAIGLVLTMDILMGGSLTGASMNPARTLGPAIAMGNFSDLWVYIVGPIAGAAAAVGIFKLLSE